MGRPRRQFAYKRLEDHAVPGQLSTVDPCADLRAAVRSWEEKTNTKVGDLRAPELTPKGQWMTTGCCHRCTGCHARDGRLSAGDCVGDPRPLRASADGRFAGYTAEDRDAVLREADGLAARGLPVTPAAVAMCLAPEKRMQPQHLSSILRKRRLQVGAATKYFLDSQPQFEAWAAARSDPSSIVHVVDHSTRPHFSWKMLVPKFWEELEALLPETLRNPVPRLVGKYFSSEAVSKIATIADVLYCCALVMSQAWCVTTDTTYKLNHMNISVTMICVVVHRKLGSRSRLLRRENNLIETARLGLGKIAFYGIVPAGGEEVRGRSVCPSSPAARRSTATLGSLLRWPTRSRAAICQIQNKFMSIGSMV